MQTHQHIRKFGHRHVMVSSVVRLGGVAFFTLLFLSALLSVNVMGVHAESLKVCSGSNRTHCIPGIHAAHSAGMTGITRAMVPNAPVGHTNVFPYPACTWGANQRYYQYHGYFVPWTANAMAWQWTARAYDFGWNVSSSPTVGSIINLQPWVQGAYGSGHVGVVERILDNGHVIASSTSWGSDPYVYTNTEFVPGSGVTFISY